MNGPINPATNARSVAASRAFCAKSLPSRSAVTSKEKRVVQGTCRSLSVAVPQSVPGWSRVFTDDDVWLLHLDHLECRLGRARTVSVVITSPTVPIRNSPVHQVENAGRRMAQYRG